MLSDSVSGRHSILIYQNYIFRVKIIYFQVGDQIPNATLYEGSPANKVNTKEAFGKGKHVLVGVVGAFTPTCQAVSIFQLVELIALKYLHQTLFGQT